MDISGKLGAARWRTRQGFAGKLARTHVGYLAEAQHVVGSDHHLCGGVWIRVERCGVSLRVQGSGFRVQGSGFRVQGSGFRTAGASCLDASMSPEDAIRWMSRGVRKGSHRST